MEIVDAFSRVGVVAGSFALYAYLMKLGQTPHWQPNDIDVFVGQSTTRDQVIDELQKNKDVSSLVEEEKDNDPYPNYLGRSSYVNHATIRVVVDNHPTWKKYNWGGLLQSTHIDDLAPDFNIREVSTLHTLLETASGIRANCDVNVILTDVTTVTGRSITDNFDLACCAYACCVSNNVLEFEFRDIAHAAVAKKKMVLMPRAFRGFDEGYSERYSIHRQLMRIRKYASRGFELEALPQ
jgi:hypothetical protein